MVQLDTERTFASFERAREAQKRRRNVGVDFEERYRLRDVVQRANLDRDGDL